MSTEPVITDLILIRHGETDWNLARRFQGHQDISLNAEGLRQAHGAARRLGQRPLDYGLATPPGQSPALLFTSDLMRCRQTAEPIGQALGLAPIVEPRLRERTFGVLEGLTVDELRRDHAESFARWQAREPDFAVERAESLRIFAARVQGVLDDLIARYAGRTLVMVTHGGVLDVVYRIGQGMPIEAPRKVEIPNASLNRLRHDGQRLTVVHWGDVSHWQHGSADSGAAAAAAPQVAP
jgi:probable phosphoglycerate mutase